MTDEYNSPPTEGDPEKLLTVCELLREGGLSRDDLYDEMQYRKRLVSDNIRYGILLGFLEESEKSIETTRRGVEASYNQDSPEELAVQFRDGIKSYPLYFELLQEISDGQQTSQDTLVLTKPKVLKALRTSFGMEGSESTLTEASTTFLKTLEVAGLGEYVVGRRGKTTRLEAVDQFPSLLSELEDTTDDSNLEEDEEVDNSSPINDSVAVEPGVQTQPVNIDRSNSGYEFHISLDITGNDDPEQVEKVVLAVRRGLSAELRELGDREDVQQLDEGERSEGAEENIQSEEEAEESSDSSDSSLNSFMKSEDGNPDEDPSESDS